MSTLFLKEIYQLRAYAWLILGISALSIVHILITERIDEYTFAAWCDLLCETGSSLEYGIVLLPLVLIVAYALFPIEHDESTIDFLHALPVSRTKIYLTKVLAGFALLSVVLLLEFVIGAVLLAANSQSIDGRFYPEFFVELVFSELVFVLAVLSHGIVLSWFRWLGLLIYFFYFAMLLSLDYWLGGAGAVSVFSILEKEIVGDSMRLAWNSIALHLAASVALLFIGYLLWSRDHRTRDAGAMPKNRRWLLSIVSALFFLLACVLLVVQTLQLGLGNNDGNLQTTTTQYYQFVVPKSSAARLAAIQSHADKDYDRLAAMLGIQSRPRIQADMTSKSEHALGVANWSKIYMNISGDETNVEYRRILSHETAHIFQSSESQGQLSNHYGSAKFFLEGMAQYAAFTLVPNPSLRSSNWQLAAIARERLSIESEDMFDFSAFVNRYDENLVYSLGDVWTQALVDTCSETILGDILRTVGREGSSLLQSGRSFWQTVLTQSDCDLDEVTDSWDALLKQVEGTVNPGYFPLYADPILKRDKLSRRFRLLVEVAGEQNLEIPERFLLKVRSQAKFSSLPASIYYGELLTDDQSSQRNANNKQQVEFVVPTSATTQGVLHYQLGYVPKNGERAFFERWRRAGLPEKAVVVEPVTRGE